MAVRLKKTVRELLASLDSRELGEWMAFMEIEEEERKRAMKGEKELTPDKVTMKVMNMAPSINRSKRKK